MRISWRLRWPVRLAGLLLALCCGPCLAAWPDHPIRLIVPFGPGGVLEEVLAASRLSVEAALGERMVVENHAGAGGNTGAQLVAAARPDGYTLLAAPSNVIVTNQFIYDRMPFDPLRDLTPVTELVEVPLLLAVSRSVPAADLREFIDYVRAHPGRVNYGSPGLSTPPHVAGELLARGASLQAVHVPYKGGGAAVTALMADEVQFMLIGYASLRGQIGSGAVRPVALAAETRLDGLPMIPTFAESGFAPLGRAIPPSWWGIFVPRGTAGLIIDRLRAAFQAALSTPDAARRMREAGLAAATDSPDAFAADLPVQAERWRSIVRELNLKAD